MVRKKKRKISFIWLLPLLLVAADQIMKCVARQYFAVSVPVIKNIFYLTFVRNFGIAFGFFQGVNDTILWFYVIVLALLVYFYDRFPKDKFSQVMFFFLIAGIVGNFIDRIALGYVTDFIDFRVWPVFNFADIYLNIGIIGLIAKEIFFKKS